jgi:hypothetical protein
LLTVPRLFFLKLAIDFLTDAHLPDSADLRPPLASGLLLGSEDEFCINECFSSSAGAEAFFYLFFAG